MSTTNDDFDDWVLQLYQSVNRPETFREYLAHLGARLGGHIVALHAEDLVHHQGTIALTAGVHEEEHAFLQSQYVDYADQNIWMQRGAAPLMKNGYVDSATVCEHREIARTDYFRRLLAPVDIDHSMGILLSTPLEGGQAILTINRSGVRRPFKPEHHALVARLRPHLSVAFQMSRRSGWHERPSSIELTALARWPDPIFILAPDLKVLWKNLPAELMLDEVVAPFSVRDKRLALFSPLDQSRIQPLVRAIATLGQRVERMVLSRRSGMKNWVISLMDYPASAFNRNQSSAGAALLIFRSEASVVPDAHSRLSSMLKLTVAEAKLALALRIERDLQAAAVQVEVSWHTARTQIKSVMQKTGTHKQTELLRLIDLCLDLP